jgi:hypothetical protein
VEPHPGVLHTLPGRPNHPHRQLYAAVRESSQCSGSGFIYSGSGSCFVDYSDLHPAVKPVFWFRIGVNVDPDRAFYVHADLVPHQDPWIRDNQKNLD